MGNKEWKIDSRLLDPSNGQLKACFDFGSRKILDDGKLRFSFIVRTEIGDVTYKGLRYDPVSVERFIVKEEDFQEAFKSLERLLTKRIPLVGRPLESLLFPEEREATIERMRRQREEGFGDRLLEELIEED